MTNWIVVLFWRTESFVRQEGSLEGAVLEKSSPFASAERVVWEVPERVPLLPQVGVIIVLVWLSFAYYYFRSLLVKKQSIPLLYSSWPVVQHPLTKKGPPLLQ